MADTLHANNVLDYTAYEGHKYLQMSSISDVLKHGEKVEIDYLSPQYIEFWTRCGEYRIMCLIDYPEYSEWMKMHPETLVNKIGE